jgi:glycosyltransferase involved in cell wall biosynthesis
VVFRSGAFPEVVEHMVTGWVCAAPTAEALAEGLEYFLSDPVRARQVGEAAWRSAEQFSAARYEHAWAELFGLTTVSGTPETIAREPESMSLVSR